MNYKNKFLLSILLLSFCIMQDCVIATKQDKDDVAFVTDYFAFISINLNLEKDGARFFEGVEKYKAFLQQQYQSQKDDIEYLSQYALRLMSIRNFEELNEQFQQLNQGTVEISSLEGVFREMKHDDPKDFEFFKAMAKSGFYSNQTNSRTAIGFSLAAGIVGLLSAGGIYYWYYKGDAKRDSSYEETDPLTDLVEE